MIQRLPQHIANQIAAGEVVQRPASVVKELMENAVDAGATEIQIGIEQAGKTLIQMVDNGQGIPASQVVLAFERHATSKIKAIDDLFDLHTKGFRGEALASISAVAKVDVFTKTTEEALGVHVQMENGQEISREETAISVGTQILVKQLFYNVPARRNFLKSDAIEFKHILDEFHRVALIHPEVAFKLYSDGSLVMHLPKSNAQQRIIHVFGKKLEGKLLSVDESTHLVSIKGFVAKPELAKKARGEQFLFVNHRFIKSAYFHKSIVDAYQGILSPDTHPSYFLSLEVDPKTIDVNIHPTKTEIKFENDSAIYSILRSAVRHALGQFNALPSLDFTLNQTHTPLRDLSKPIALPNISVDPHFNPFDLEHQSKMAQSCSNKDYSSSLMPSKAKESMPSYASILNQELPTMDQAETLHALFDEMDSSPVQFFQWQNQYIVCNIAHQCHIIDQHRAHQAILYHQMSQSPTSLNPQMLTHPLVLSFSTQECAWLQSQESTLTRFGFTIEWGHQQISILAVPESIAHQDIPSIMASWIHNPDSVQDYNPLEDSLKRAAKAMAIKKGQSLNALEMESLINRLMAIREVFSPYGKPIMVSLSLSQIQNQLN